MRTIGLRFLFISESFLTDQSTRVSGVYKLMDMFTDAIKEFVLLDMLFYVPSVHMHLTLINGMGNTLRVLNGEIDNGQ